MSTSLHCNEYDLQLFKDLTSDVRQNLQSKGTFTLTDVVVALCIAEVWKILVEATSFVNEA